MGTLFTWNPDIFTNHKTKDKFKKENTIYQGSWENGVRCGFGWSWNEKRHVDYVGEWKDNNVHGLGVHF